MRISSHLSNVCTSREGTRGPVIAIRGGDDIRLVDNRVQRSFREGYLARRWEGEMCRDIQFVGNRASNVNESGFWVHDGVTGVLNDYDVVRYDLRDLGRPAFSICPSQADFPRSGNNLNSFGCVEQSPPVAPCP